MTHPCAAPLLEGAARGTSAARAGLQVPPWTTRPPNLALLLTGPSRIATLLPAVAGGILLQGPAAERARYTANERSCTASLAGTARAAHSARISTAPLQSAAASDAPRSWRSSIALAMSAPPSRVRPVNGCASRIAARSAVRNGSTVDTIAVRIAPSRMRPMRKNTLGRTVLPTASAVTVRHASPESRHVNDWLTTLPTKKAAAAPSLASADDGATG